MHLNSYFQSNQILSGFHHFEMTLCYKLHLGNALFCAGNVMSTWVSNALNAEIELENLVKSLNIS